MEFGNPRNASHAEQGAGLNLMVQKSSKLPTARLWPSYMQTTQISTPAPVQFLALLQVLADSRCSR